MHKNEDIFVKQAQEFSPRLFYFVLWHGGQTSDKGEKNPKNEILNSTTPFGGGIYSRTVKVYSFI